MILNTYSPLSNLNYYTRGWTLKLTSWSSHSRKGNEGICLRLLCSLCRIQQVVQQKGNDLSLPNRLSMLNLLKLPNH